MSHLAPLEFCRPADASASAGCALLPLPRTLHIVAPLRAAMGLAAAAGAAGCCCCCCKLLVLPSASCIGAAGVFSHTASIGRGAGAPAILL